MKAVSTALVPLLKKIDKLFKVLRRKKNQFIINAMAGRQKSFVSYNDTRWSSRISTINSYLDNVEFIRGFPSRQVVGLMPNNLEEIDLRNFQQLHIKYEATIKLLQQERFPLNKVRDLFGMLSQDCEEAMRPFLEYPSRIMKHPTFECAIVKVLDGYELQLTAQEKNTLTIFQKQVAVEEAREVVLEDSLQLQLERLEQRRKEATSSKLKFFYCDQYMLILQ
ncbi:hypothetical protein RCL1_007276 [Eukaryota sp. TZLM3-RCL]